jgi:hypothetical protein
MSSIVELDYRLPNGEIRDNHEITQNLLVVWNHDHRFDLTVLMQDHFESEYLLGIYMALDSRSLKRIRTPFDLDSHTKLLLISKLYYYHGNSSGE